MSEKNTQSTQVQTETFTCPNCGGGLHFDGKKEKFLCSSCGYEGELHAGDNSVDEWDFNDYARREAASVAFEGMAVADCQNCGSQVTFAEHQTATVCPMCGSTQISEAKQKAGIPPEGILPFQVDKQEAAQKFREWVKGLWFAPNRLKVSYQEGNLSGHFVPFWTFDADCSATYTGEGGRDRTVKDKDGKEHTETDWFPTAGSVQESFDDILVTAVTGESASDTELVGPYDTINKLRPYAPEYLAGYQAELYTVKADAGFETAKKRIDSSLRDLADSDIRRRFDSARNVQIFPQYKNVTYKHVLLPVWSSLFGYGGKTYRYVVNGSTGNVYGQRPYSIPKIVTAIAVVAAILIGVIAFFASGSDEGMDSVPVDEVAMEQIHAEIPSLQQFYSQIEPTEL